MNIKLLSEHGYEEIPGFLDYLINEEGNVVRKDGFIPKTILNLAKELSFHVEKTIEIIKKISDIYKAEFK